MLSVSEFGPLISLVFFVCGSAYTRPWPLIIRQKKVFFSLVVQQWTSLLLLSDSSGVNRQWLGWVLYCIVISLKSSSAQAPQFLDTTSDGLGTNSVLVSWVNAAVFLSWDAHMPAFDVSGHNTVYWSLKAFAREFISVKFSLEIKLEDVWCP